VVHLGRGSAAQREDREHEDEETGHDRDRRGTDRALSSFLQTRARGS
jgi:hypothetical protein